MDFGFATILRPDFWQKTVEQLLGRIVQRGIGLDRRINLIYLTREAQKLQDETMAIADKTLHEALETVPADKIDVCKEVLQIVYDNLK